MSRFSSRKSRAEVREGGVQVALGLVELVAAAADLDGLALEELLHRHAGDGVEGVEDLVDVDLGDGLVDVDRAAVGDLGVAALGQLEVDDAVGDARDRGQADGRAGALVQRRVVRGVDLDRDRGLAVGRDLEVLDGADLGAGDLDVVALHELAGVQEVDLEVVARGAGAEHEEGEGSDHDEERRAHGDPPERAYRAHDLTSLPSPSARLQEMVPCSGRRSIDREKGAL
ncbi:MAG: hypothetical protein WKF31_12210 [Thermoleophilaceae bacterium]